MNNRKPSIEVYLEVDQKIAIKKSAADARVSISEYCVGMIFKGHVQSTLSPEEIKLMASLSGIANNLNQALKRMHQEKDSPERLLEVLNVIQKIEKILR